MTPRPWLAITSILALLAGIGLGLLLVPNLRTRTHIDDVASTSFDERRRAWDWLQSSPGPFPLEQVNLALLDAPPEAMLHGARELQRMQSWDWNSQSNDVMARYMSLLLWRSHIMDTEDVIILIGQSPIDMPDDTMLELGATLFNHPDATVARRGFDALVSWCGYRPILLRMLDTLPPSRMDWSTHYLHLHERGRTPLKIGSESGVAPTTPGNMAAWPSSRTEAEHLLFDSVRIAAQCGTDEQRKATAEHWLQDRQAAADPHVELSPEPGPRRRMAGALLAAHEQLDPRPIEHAMVIEEDATARTVMRLAIDATGPAWNDEDPGDFARRALPVDEGISLYPMYCRTLAGDLTLLEPLLQAAAEGEPSARAQTLTLVPWLLPEWVDARADSPSDATAMDMFFQRLLARWRLEHRWVVNSTNSADDVNHD